ncbi:unnamed protein product [Peronospora belbahrii]|uniref:Uncharacterized protein n=1 Tax=Peronospora belbahrii TaxID=622444 RepID=A0AAU9KL45_9STRA|nr:unnamed protein product [Peronospora belbahrii]CAH0520565.1 unnamed protein product [Peronospora belbahrii]
MRSVNILAQLCMHLVQQQPSGFITSLMCSSRSYAGSDSASYTSCATKSVNAMSESDSAASVSAEIFPAMTLGSAFAIKFVAEGTSELGGARVGAAAVVGVALAGDSGATDGNDGGDVDITVFV